MRLCTLAGVIVLSCGLAAPAAGAARWSVGGYLGTVWNLRTPLKIHQSGFEDVRVRARYETRPFEVPLYWMARLERSEGPLGWALALVHHKLHLTNLPPEVDEFSITHGYNLLTVERIWRDGPFTRSFGAGVVITHPENTVRGRKLAEDGGPLGRGYHLSGPVVSMALARELRLAGGWFLPLECRTTAAWARVPVVDGHADAPNLAVHWLFGIGKR